MLFVHIGMHKAGSTSIQAFMNLNAARFAEQGLFYPASSDVSNAHHFIARSLRTSPPIPEWPDILRLAEDRTVLLSSEHFCLMDPARLAEVLGGRPVRILCWQRNAADGVVSRYSQETKNARNIHPFDSFFSRLTDSEHLFIAPLIGRWAETFGPEAVRLRSLDAEVLEGGELISDLLHAIGARPDPGLVDPGRQNASPGWRSLETIRRLSLDIRRLGPVDDQRTQRFLHKIMPRVVIEAEARLGYDQRGAYLSPAQAAEFAARYNDDIAALSALGLDCRMKPLRVEEIPTTDTPLTEASMPWETRARLLQAAFAGMSALDVRTRRKDAAGAGEEDES